jgi:SSS family solute:Na+ symporter
MQFLDILVIFVYMAGVIWAGLRSRSKEGDSEDYFTAKQGFHGVLGMIMVGFSMAATLFSGISFVIYTSVAYQHGAGIAASMLGLPLILLFLKLWFLPRYLAGSGSHPYDIIEDRLGGSVRLCISAMFILLRIVWMAVMLVAPTLVLMGAAGLGQEWFWPIVITTGVVCTLYTTIGGIRSVIITDAIQFAVMGAGMILIISIILWKLGLPVGDIVGQLSDAGRLKVFDFTFDLTNSYTVWTMVFGLAIANLGSYTGDLMMLQRYLAAESPKAAAKAFAINTWGVLIVVTALIIAGLLLWVWFQHHPSNTLPENPDQVLAYFITKELPAGIAGLLIASILAATMSSMTSGIIALSGTITNDWVERYGRTRTSVELVRIGRICSVGIGAISIGCAGLAYRLGDLFSSTQQAMGAFLGPMLACMVIVVAGWKVRPFGVILGMVLGTIAGWSVPFTPLSPIWVGTGSALVTLLVSAPFRRQD